MTNPDITDIINVLMSAEAVDCTLKGYKPQLYASNSILFEIPDGYFVTVDYNKLAKALYDAGYRKGNHDDSD